MITQRGLDKAVNRPDKLYTSVRDPVHSGRLVIPFYDIHDKIAWYQSRGISKRDLEQYPKYLSKVDGEKHLFGVNMVNPFSDHVFIFEGPLDCFFVTDSISVAGINEKTDFIMTPKQKEQMEIFNFHEKIWVLDSQYQDKAAYDKTQNLIEMGYNVFIWPEKFGKAFKDFNDIAIRGKRNKIPHKFILDNTCSGLEAEIKLSAIKKPR